MSALSPLYADLSHYYDRFCNDIDYVQQSNFASRAFGLFCDNPGRDYLDLACGTGLHLQALLARGFTGSGLDNSPAMLALAAERCPQAAFILGDMAALDAADSYDLITCFLYSLHYSHPHTQLEQTLIQVYQALKPGGIFLFNTVDAGGISNTGGVCSQVSEADQILSFNSGWEYPGQGETMMLQIRIARQQGPDHEQWQESHPMSALGFGQLQTLLMTCGFEVQMLEHDYETIRRWEGDSHNAIVIAAKPLADTGGIPHGL